MADEANKAPGQEAVDPTLQKDVEDFNAELIPLLGKYQVGLGAATFITPDGRIGARPTLFRAPTPPPAKPEGNEPADSTTPPPSSPAGEAVPSPLPAKELESSEV